MKEDRRADRQAEARADTVAHRISRREQGQVLAKCGSCPDAQLTDLCVALRFTAAPVKITQQLLTSAYRRRLGELRTETAAGTKRGKHLLLFPEEHHPSCIITANVGFLKPP